MRTTAARLLSISISAEIDTGIVITPFAGSTTIQSMLLYTANDHSSRDPASWKIFGTNDPYDHVANTNGTSVLPGVTWTQLGAGNVAMPGTLPGGGQFLPSPPNPPNTPNPANTGRFEAGPLLTFPNTNPYTTYRILFPTVKDAARGQFDAGIGDRALSFTRRSHEQLERSFDFDASSAFQLPKPDSRFNPGERPAWAIDAAGINPTIFSSGFPGNEGPANVVDGAGTDGSTSKYLNSARPKLGLHRDARQRRLDRSQLQDHHGQRRRGARSVELPALRHQLGDYQPPEQLRHCRALDAH